MTEYFERFAAYLKLSDQMIEQASKAEVADVARVRIVNHPLIVANESFKVMGG